MRALALVLVLAACTAAPVTPPAAPRTEPATAPRPSAVARPLAAPLAPLAAIEASVDADGVRVGASDAPATIVILFASWCGHCRHQLAALAEVRAAHPRTRILGVNYVAHEEYDGRGSSAAVRAYVTTHAPWLRVVPADDALFTTLGRPPFVPTVLVFDRAGALVARFDRRERTPPTAAELGDALQDLK